MRIVQGFHWFAVRLELKSVVIDIERWTRPKISLTQFGINQQNQRWNDSRFACAWSLSHYTHALFALWSFWINAINQQLHSIASTFRSNRIQCDCSACKRIIYCCSCLAHTACPQFWSVAGNLFVVHSLSKHNRSINLHKLKAKHRGILFVCRALAIALFKLWNISIILTNT